MFHQSNPYKATRILLRRVFENANYHADAFPDSFLSLELDQFQISPNSFGGLLGGRDIKIAVVQ